MSQILLLFFAPVLLAGVYHLGRRKSLRDLERRQAATPSKKGDDNTESQADGPGAVDQFLYDRCCRYMADRKPFLVESFSLGDLASVLFTNKVYLSKTINYYSGKNLSGDVRDGTVPEEQVAHSVGTRSFVRIPLGHHLQSGLQGRHAGVSEYLVRPVEEEKPRIS